MISKFSLIRWIASIAAFLFVIAFLLSSVGVLPWSPINCWHYDVDIHSGRIRYTRYIAFLPISERVDASALSAVLRPEDVHALAPDWRRVLTLSPGVRNSPHYSFHSAISQIGELERAWRVGSFGPEARRSSARHVLELWQQGQSDSQAVAYLLALTEAAFQEREHQNEGEERLPGVQ